MSIHRALQVLTRLELWPRQLFRDLSVLWHAIGRQGRILLGV